MMELKPKCEAKVIKMIEKGVHIPNPLNLDIGDEVDIDLISADNVTVYPGVRIYGSKTVISAGTKIGYEGPVTIDDCQIGKDVELKGGSFVKSVFLDKASMGLASQVREGCILEEESGGAHCVGLKQTILFPFVTLGSLINFCDCFMAGGTNRKNHSEVGSSYIHFNFTPDGDKTTPSLIGDVPRGVMLNQPPIFLGGQGGMVGPLRMGFGNVVAAGSILRTDYTDENKLIIGKHYAGGVRNYEPATYPNLARIVENNILYIANLYALEQWYIHVRKPFLERTEFGINVFEGLLDKLALAKKERFSRLEAMAKRAIASKNTTLNEEKVKARCEFHDNLADIRIKFEKSPADDSIAGLRDDFLAHLNFSQQTAAKYIETIQSLSPEISQKGTKWLGRVVNGYCTMAACSMPSLNMFIR
jgi:bifunctional UDP-N-acetylglucosamine pyrophosphorylase / glucosamine-1-phosphate N-acetyltransferase